MSATELPPSVLKDTTHFVVSVLFHFAFRVRSLVIGVSALYSAEGSTDSSNQPSNAQLPVLSGVFKLSPRLEFLVTLTSSKVSASPTFPPLRSNLTVHVLSTGGVEGGVGAGEDVDSSVLPFAQPNNNATITQNAKITFFIPFSLPYQNYFYRNAAISKLNPAKMLTPHRNG